MDIQIDFSKVKGRMKPLHGVNNGPVCFGSLVDVSGNYRELGIPYARLHDPNWPHPREVDIPQIFPDFNADPEDPASYDFSRTDTYLKSILDLGTQVIYRLGISIEHTKRKYYVQPPEDFDKWARICVHIIMHYNEGWAEGFHYGIRYWEIWNEPDGYVGGQPEKSSMWAGTFEQYMELYKTASKAIRQYDSKLMVGGYAAAFVQTPNMEKFLAFVERERLPLDFFSWHTYADNPEIILKNARVVRSMLDMHGLETTESHCNEWNYIKVETPDFMDIFAPGSEAIRKKTFEKTRGMEGAAFAAAVLASFQDSSVDIANYYDGQPTNLFCGLYDCYGAPEKPFYAFKAYKKLYDCGIQAEAEIAVGTDGLYCCAAVGESGKEACILLSNCYADIRDYSIKLAGLNAGQKYLLEKYVLDEDRNLELSSSQVIDVDDKQLELFMKKQMVVLLNVKKLK